MDGSTYNRTDRDGNPNVWNVNANDGKRWLNVNNAKPTNRWNADNKFVFRSRNFFLFPPSLELAVFLFWAVQAFLPASENFPNLDNICGKIGILFMRKYLCFPSHMDKKLERVGFKNAVVYFCFLPLLVDEIGSMSKF